MEINTIMSASDKAVLDQKVDLFNKANATDGRVAQQQLGKDDFLKLLIAQLSHQDPTSPMENTDFIAQMAQFSSLEQVTNMAQGFQTLSTMLNTSSAMGALGHEVQVDSGDGMVSGIVEAITAGDKPKVCVNSVFYDADRIRAIYE